MADAPIPGSGDDRARHKRAVRMAIVLGVLAVVIYLGFYGIRAWLG
ncbi:MAG: hypothetical protein ACYCS1_02875 [Gammaproteobacteria bacterium]